MRKLLQTGSGMRHWERNMDVKQLKPLGHIKEGLWAGHMGSYSIYKGRATCLKWVLSKFGLLNPKTQTVRVVPLIYLAKRKGIC